MRFWLHSATVCCCLLLMTSVAAAGIITIDDFTAVETPSLWPIELAIPGMTSATEDPALAGVLGGVRTTTIVGESFGVPALDKVTVAIIPSPFGRLGVTTSGAADGLVRLLYDGGGSGLGADFSTATGIRIDIPLFDRAGGVDMPVRVSLHDGLNTIMLERFLTTPGGQSVYFPFADFSGIGGFNLATINSTEVTFDPQTSQDFHVELIETFNIPEPQSLALAGVGCATLALLGWRPSRGRSPLKSSV